MMFKLRGATPRLFVLLGALASSSAANAQVPRVQTSRPRQSGPEFVVDVRQFGALADGKTDNALAFQRAVDYLGARIDKEIPSASGNRTNGVVFIPAAADSYRLSRPIWVDHQYIEIRGEGQGTRVETFPTRSHPLFLFGLRRVAQVKIKDKVETLEATAKYRPDLFGKLDATAVRSKGARGGFRTHGETLIQSQASPLADGPRHSRQDWTTDHWHETTRLTVEFAIEGPNGEILPAGVPLFGMGVASKDLAYPLVVYTDAPNHYLIKFSTQPKRFGPQSPHRFAFSSGNARGIQRLAFQIDLEKASVSAFVNGREVGVEEGLGPEWKPGLRFAENDYFPLLIGDNGGARPALGAANGKDWTLAGLLFSKSIRYQHRAAGQSQRRVDRPEAAISDEYRYFTPRDDDRGVIGYFPFTDRPDETSRMLMIQGGFASNEKQAAAFLIHSLQNQPGGIIDNSIRDLHLIGANLYGQNIAIGQVLDLRISGVRSSSAYHGIGSLNNGANYIVRVEDCTFDATDSGYYALDQVLWARNLHFSGAGRATMRLVGSSVNVENVFVGFHAPNSESTIKIHAGDYGGNYAFRNVQVDYEGDVYAHTPIYAEVHPYTPETSVRLTDVFLGSVGKDVPLITLKDGEPGWGKSGYLSVDILQVFSKKIHAVIDTNGDGWRGRVRGLSSRESPKILRNGNPVTDSRILIEP